MAVSCLLTGALVWGLIWFPYRALQEAGVGGALGSLLTYFFALVNVLSCKATQVDEAVKAGAVWAGVVLVALPAAILTERPVQALAAMNARTWLLVGLIAMTLFCINLVVQFGLARTTANRAIVIMLAELVFAAASSYIPGLRANRLARLARGCHACSRRLVLWTAGSVSARLIGVRIAPVQIAPGRCAAAASSLSCGVRPLWL